MAKKLAVLMTLICIGLAAVVVQFKLRADGDGPEITFANPDLEYDGNMGDAELLADVKAMDAVEGDVSDSLTVENVYSVSENEIVVVYVAKDSSNNITKEKRFIKGSEVASSGNVVDVTLDKPLADVAVEESDDVLDQMEPEMDEAGTANAEDSVLTGTPGPEPMSTGVPEVEKSEADLAREEQEKLAEDMPSGCPKIYLSDYWIEVPVGTTIDALSYVEEITDETDDSFELWKRIQIYDANGNQPGANISFPVAGTYKYSYLVVDNQSNNSNRATLTVVVE